MGRVLRTSSGLRLGRGGRRRRGCLCDSGFWVCSRLVNECSLKHDTIYPFPHSTTLIPSSPSPLALSSHIRSFFPHWPISLSFQGAPLPCLSAQSALIASFHAEAKGDDPYLLDATGIFSGGFTMLLVCIGRWRMQEMIARPHYKSS